MNIAKARALLTVNPKILTFEQLLKHRVKLIDAWRESKADYGMAQAVKGGFYKEVLNEYSSGYTPADLWLTKNLTVRLDEVEELIRATTDTLYNLAKRPLFIPKRKGIHFYPEQQPPLKSVYTASHGIELPIGYKRMKLWKRN